MTLIKWKQRAAQVKDYENLILNGYTPTDIDFIYDVILASANKETLIIPSDAGL